MTHQRRMALGLLALAAVAFVLSRTFPAPPEPAPPPSAPPPVAQPSTPKPTRAPISVQKRSGARQALPRPVPAPAPEPDEPDEPGEPEAGPAEGDDTGDALPERGWLAPAAVPFTPDTLMEAVRDGMPAVQACVEGWMDTLELDEALAGRLSIEVTLTPDGVEDAAVVDVEGMPAPLLSCFGGVVYEIEWPRPEEATTISMPFVVTDDEP